MSFIRLEAEVVVGITEVLPGGLEGQVTGQGDPDGSVGLMELNRCGNALYLFSIKGANSLSSQLTDDDLGTSTGVNIRSHYFRFDLGLAKKNQLQSLFFVQNELRSSGQFPNFFVPLGAFTPRQFRLQEQIVFTFRPSGSPGLLMRS